MIKDLETIDTYEILSSPNKEDIGKTAYLLETDYIEVDIGWNKPFIKIEKFFIMQIENWSGYISEKQVKYKGRVFKKYITNLITR